MSCMTPCQVVHTGHWPERKMKPTPPTPMLSAGAPGWGGRKTLSLRGVRKKKAPPPKKNAYFDPRMPKRPISYSHRSKKPSKMDHLGKNQLPPHYRGGGEYSIYKIHPDKFHDGKISRTFFLLRRHPVVPAWREIKRKNLH